MIEADIKDKLIKRIQEFENSEILEEIYSWLEDESGLDVYVTSDAQKKAIQEGLDQIKKGETLNEEDANREIDKWLDGGK